ncbi:MAG: hypothetical protein AYK19_21095 [Theionarchaea archaeon DG-70-1]|nr:MAG: hypothetical protein AYK19_21095 [Theionarchaea archaeon DG-70-1]
MLLICLLCSSIAKGVDDWPMFQHDPQHSGYSSSLMPEFLKEIWTKDGFGTGLRFVISEEKLFVSEHLTLSALDINTGSVLWNQLSMSSLSVPAVENNRVYVNGLGWILCLDADTGEVIWHHAVEFLDFLSYPIVVDGHVIVGGGRPTSDTVGTPENIEALERAETLARRVVCLDAETGEVVWKFFAQDSTYFSPTHFDGRVYTNDGYRHVYCLDAQTGEVIWRKKIEWTSSSDLSLDGKRIFVGTYNGIVCLDLETGETLWKFGGERWIFSTLAVAYNKIFAGTIKGGLYCLDAENGEVIWKKETESGISSSIVVADGKAAFGTKNGMLYIIEAQSGEVCESLDLGDDKIEALALSDGKLFVGLGDGRISCFEGDVNESSSPGSSSPGSSDLRILFSIIALSGVLIGVILARHLHH